jgi:hypothetical protein
MQVVARLVTLEEMLLSLSITIMEKDVPPPGLRSSISVEAGGGERNKFIDPYDMGVSPPRVGGSNVSLDHGTPSANEIDDSELPQV